MEPRIPMSLRVVVVLAVVLVLLLGGAAPNVADPSPIFLHFEALPTY
jgi:hypothetical protein